MGCIRIKEVVEYLVDTLKAAVKVMLLDEFSLIALHKKKLRTRTLM